jgi:hypothetical protein
VAEAGAGRSSGEAESVRLGFVTVLLSEREASPSGPRGTPVNCGHSDDFSRESRARKWDRGEVWDI